jgi:transcriptional regulator with XRE-family HTH domain
LLLIIIGMTEKRTDDDSLFVQRVRSLMTERRMTVGDLAERSELDPSLVSRLLAATVSARREPRIEHILALARAFEITPGELVEGTEGALVLRAWVPREEFDAEATARVQAQTQAAESRTELAGARAEIDGLRQTISELSGGLAQVRHQLDASQRSMRDASLARDVAIARATQAIAERDQSLRERDTYYRAWSNMNSRALQLQRDLAGAKNSAAVGWVAALFAGGAAIVAAADDAPPARSRTASRGRRRGR